ncbi:MAG: UDP-N-acetylmuramate dehydrogenase [Bacteroidales bacterium]|nr:UDP-N-acetylmuramate dehydrogenase [Bacteroidales bacterium]HPD95138.1 UDP-N-acetylmuramate dehydrogenase [Tenuifilaceae bacterium]
MFVIKKNISLKPNNTFGIDVSTRYFARANTVEKIIYSINFASYNRLPIYVLGGGSNVLLTSDIEGVVVNSAINGIAMIEESGSDVTLSVGAGVVWDDFVAFAVQKGWGGVENLSYIPGCVGAAPIQNIGAYGVEAEKSIIKVEYIDIAKRKLEEINHSECRFGYRDSIFKQELKGKVIITNVWFRLSKKLEFRVDYGSLQTEVAKLGEVTLSNIRNAVIDVRKRKLPDPKEVGNAGSFFKNPIVEVEVYRDLKVKFPEIPFYQLSDSLVKIPAGWLIEQAGWKGKRVGNCGVHQKQALVIVNYGGATGKEILAFAKSIQESVASTFGLELEMEVNIL